MSTKEILSFISDYAPLQDRLESRPKDRERVITIIEEIKGNFNRSVVSGIRKTIDFSFMHLYDGLNFEMPEDMDFQDLVKKNCVILVPNHQSHADYVALTYLIFSKYSLPLYVAGGINLNIFGLGKLFRNAGCFFIRRSFHSDILYKLVMEGYLGYLLSKGYPIEFFFEGGRSRTGKLLPPRFGLFSMLLHSHHAFYDKINRPLVFIPVSINHEYVPETKSHLRELHGAKKKKESLFQLLKVYKLFSLRLGSLNVRFGRPIPTERGNLLKTYVQDLAFDCFKKVGEQMMVTPTSLLSLILLDESSGALTWEQIYADAHQILEYCRKMKIPVSAKLDKSEEVKSLKNALNILMANKKVELIRNEKLSKDYYAIKVDSRAELLYFKNTIIHHFLVPYLISAAWIHVFNQKIVDLQGLKKFLLRHRRQLKFEFYLPTIKELVQDALKVIKHETGSDVSTLDEAMALPGPKMVQMMKRLSIFSRVCNYIFEAYYIAALTVKHFADQEFTREEFLKMSKEVYQLERNHGRMIKYTESYSVPMMKNSIDYFENLKILERCPGAKFKVMDMRKVDQVIDEYTRHLLEVLTVSYRLDPAS